ncbi:hypothetical protein [Shewanella sp. KX20019]|uniref:hypothetical protein n=1 Tax=Shewanella sp. KX20019 TaxID=2803864 RepID=UPI001F3FEE9C|nr:hypothetical protein [Shewanella sp. KX20019]
MTVKMQGQITKNSQYDNYPLVDDKSILGGIRAVKTKDDLSTLDSSTLKNGTIAVITDDKQIVYYFDSQWIDLMSLGNYYSIERLFGNADAFVPNKEYNIGDIVKFNDGYYFFMYKFKGETPLKGDGVAPLTLQSLHTYMYQIHSVVFNGFAGKSNELVDGKFYKAGETFSMMGFVYGVNRDSYISMNDPSDDGEITILSLRALFDKINRISPHNGDDIIIRDRILYQENENEKVAIFKRYKEHHSYAFGNGEYDLILNSYSTPKMFTTGKDKSVYSMPIEGVFVDKVFDIDKELKEVDYTFTASVIIESLDIMINEEESLHIEDCQAEAYVMDYEDPDKPRQRLVLTSDYAYVHNHENTYKLARFQFDKTVITSIGEEYIIKIVDNKNSGVKITAKGKIDDKGVFKSAYKINGSEYAISAIASRETHIIGDITHDFNVQTSDKILKVVDVKDSVERFLGDGGTSAKHGTYFRYEYDFDFDDLSVNKFMIQVTGEAKEIDYTIRVTYGNYVDSYTGGLYLDKDSPTNELITATEDFKAELFIPKGSKIELTIRTNKNVGLFGSTQVDKVVFKPNLYLYGFERVKTIVPDWHVEPMLITGDMVKNFEDNLTKNGIGGASDGKMFDGDIGRTVIRQMKLINEDKDEVMEDVTVKLSGSYESLSPTNEPNELISTQFNDGYQASEISMLFAASENAGLINAVLSMEVLTKNNGIVKLPKTVLSKPVLPFTPHGLPGLTFDTSGINDDITGFSISLVSGEIVESNSANENRLCGFGIGIKTPNLLV